MLGLEVGNCWGQFVVDRLDDDDDDGCVLGADSIAIQLLRAAELRGVSAHQQDEEVRLSGDALCV
jgi:hypothetical protein